MSDETMPDGRPGTWTNRRRVIFISLLYIGVAVGYLIFKGEDTGLHQDIASGLILLAGGIIGSYVFGAVWDDNRKIRNASSQQDK